MAVRWIVEHGSYSDYEVICVCDSEERAKALAARLNAEERDEDYRASTVSYVDYDQWDLVTVYLIRAFCNADGSRYTPTRWHWALRPWAVPPLEHEWVAPPDGAGPWQLTVFDTDQARAEERFRRLSAHPPAADK